MTRVLLLTSGKNFGDISEQTEPKLVRATYLLPIWQDIHVQTQIMRPPSHRMSNCLDGYTNLSAPLPSTPANLLTHAGIRLWYRYIRPDSLVLPPNEHPKPNTIRMMRKMCRDALLELDVRLLFEHAESGQLGREPVLVFEAGKIESLMLLKGLICNDLDGKVQVLLVTFAALALGYALLFLDQAL